MSKQKSYSQEFRDEADRQTVTNGKSVRQVAKELGININTLHAWRRDAISERRMPVPDVESDAEKIKRLERELKLITEERDIIKKLSPTSRSPRRSRCPSAPRVHHCASGGVLDRVDVSRLRHHQSAHYASLSRDESDRSKQDTRLREKITELFNQSAGAL